MYKNAIKTKPATSEKQLRQKNTYYRRFDVLVETVMHKLFWKSTYDIFGDILSQIWAL